MTGLEFMTAAQFCHGRFPLMMLKTLLFELFTAGHTLGYALGVNQKLPDLLPGSGKCLGTTDFHKYE